ncbi:MAG: hypothetical protein QM308_07420 [Bacillota bacterium]|nr:hypothetical protein [Bacillota bacterium]
MKRVLAALLAVLMMIAVLPITSPPAQAKVDDFTISASVTSTYVGEFIRWTVSNVTGGSGNYKYQFVFYKNGDYFGSNFMSADASCDFVPPSPGRYKVKVTVYDGMFGLQKESAEVTVKARPIRITKVEPLGATSLKITWGKVEGATLYEVWRSTSMNSGWTLAKKTFDTSFSNTYLTAGTRYFYKVRYYVPSFEWDDYISAFSPVAAGVPMAKTRITSLTSPSARRIRMTWAKAAGASGYQVAMASRANGSYKSVRIVTGGTTAIFSGVKSGSTLFFKVRPYRRVYTTTYWGQYSAYRSVRVK